MSQPDYDFEDFRDFFKVALGSVITRQGIQMAADGHFEALVTNASGVARSAARALQKERKLHVPENLPTPLPPVRRGALSIEPPKTTKEVKA